MDIEFSRDDSMVRRITRARCAEHPDSAKNWHYRSVTGRLSLLSDSANSWHYRGTLRFGATIPPNPDGVLDSANCSVRFLAREAFGGPRPIVPKSWHIQMQKWISRLVVYVDTCCIQRQIRIGGEEY